MQATLNFIFGYVIAVFVAVILTLLGLAIFSNEIANARNFVGTFFAAFIITGITAFIPFCLANIVSSGSGIDTHTFWTIAGAVATLCAHALFGMAVFTASPVLLISTVIGGASGGLAYSAFKRQNFFQREPKTDTERVCPSFSPSSGD